MTIPVALLLLDHPTEHVGVVTSTGAAPTITSDGGGATADVSVGTGDTAVTTVVASDTGTITYSIVGGAEAGMFEIDPDSGELAFTETSVDGEYEVIVAATSDWGIDRQTITVTVEAGYHADAVHFDGASELICASLTALDGPDAYGFAWVKFNATALIFWVIDPEGDYLSQCGDDAATKMLWDFVPADFASDLSFESSNTVLNAQWHSVLWSVEADASAGNKKAKLYIDDVDVTSVLADTGASFNIAANGKSFHVGGDGGDFITGDVAIFFWKLGTSLLDGGGDIPLATRRLFVTAANKPVDPAVAVASLGNPTILLNGDATGFQTNQGTGGAFTLTGSLTNASTSPSD